MQYRIYKDGALLTTVTNASSYSFTGFKQLSTHVLGVSAWNGIRESTMKTVTVKTRGNRVKIPTTIAVGTAVTIRYQEYSLGLVPIGTEPTGYFGGGAKSTLPAKIVAASGGISTAEFTVQETAFPDGTAMTKQADGTFAAFNGYKAIYYG